MDCIKSNRIQIPGKDTSLDSSPRRGIVDILYLLVYFYNNIV